MAAKSSVPALPPGTPEFAVDRDTLIGFFHPPIGKSTFHDLVGKGLILPVKGLRGFYRLNESLVRLGLRPVASMPKDTARSGEDLMRWAFTMVDPILFPSPSWMLRDQPTDLERQTAQLIASVHRLHVEAFESVEEKLAYAAGALDAQNLLDRQSNEAGSR
ncbi:hypothetical protein OKA04_18495 [Luteolibacter flavescens]|uniref:Uncharacterized protein n=1 Tax=Luteolibacter flavescens TaxID=1859460 RepID=A0ABT3FUR4_9BACT|nr:hypothetical protein [Luteolibacter flavescens]MCW1886735.1 hypothetical protein [Luteolibacter flavescens]